jgi:hypothetical protein
MMARATASTLAPTRIEKSTKVWDMKLEKPPRPDEKSARFAPKTITWNDMTVLIRFREYAIEARPIITRIVAVAMKIS